MLSKITFCDDDRDNIYLFKEAVSEIDIPATITVARNGNMLMHQLINSDEDDLPEIVFIDLHLHGKRGDECMFDIHNINALKDLSVVILSTSYNQKVVDNLYEKGACYFIQKPNDFNIFKKRIKKAINLITENPSQPAKEDFYLT